MHQVSLLNSKIKFSEIYHYREWDNYTVENENLHSVTFKWCNFSQCKFIHTILADSDWDSCQVSECEFKDISFENSDITSTYFENCNFHNVCFKGASMTDLTFSNCTFNDCDFNHMGLSSSVFDKCFLVNFKLRQSTTSLNSYKKCLFTNAKIRGNFFYNLFLDSNFIKSTISEELVCVNFGFSKKNLIELSLDKEHLKNIQQTCLDNKDIVGATIISLNLEENFYDCAIWTSIQIILKQLKAGILIRSEQLLFLRAVIKYLMENNKISLYTILAIISTLEKLNTFEQNIALQKSKEVINQLNNELFDYYHKYIKQIDNELKQVNNFQNEISLKITYEEEPKVSLCVLLEQLMSSLGINGPAPIRKQTARGSFIEWIQGYDNILKCLQLLISILGLGIKLKKKTEKQPEIEKSQDTLPNKNVPNITNSVVFQMPESVLEQLKMAQTEQDVSKAINVFILNGVTFNNNFQGYNNYNVKDIEIL